MPPADWTKWEVPGPSGLVYFKDQVLALLGISEDTLSRLIADRRFPVGIKVSPGSAPVWTGQDLAVFFAFQARLAPAPPEKPDRAEKEKG